MWRKFVDIPLLVFFLFSIFYLIKNVLLDEKTNYKTISEYKQSIRGLKILVEKENQKNLILRKTLSFLEDNPRQALELFIRDYLWKLKKGENLYLKDKN
jgi:hypothetical protein